MSLLRRGIAALAAAALVATLAAAPAAAATFQFDLHIGSTCVGFRGADSTTYTITVLDGAEVLDRVSVTTDGGGWGMGCGVFKLATGIKVRAQRSGFSRTITIPPLGFRTNRVTDVVSGAGPAGKDLTVRVYRLVTGTYGNGPDYAKAVTVTAGGTFSTDLTSLGGFRGGDEIAVEYFDEATGDLVWDENSAEFMRVLRGNPRAEGSLDPGGATLELRNPSGGVRGRARMATHWYSHAAIGEFRTGAGSLVYPRTGDKVVGDFATDAVLTIPAITVSADVSTDVVTVTCPGMVGQGVLVFVDAPDWSDGTYRYGVTNASGVRSWDVTADLDVVVGTHLYGQCRFDTGDEVAREGRVLP